MHRNFNLVHNTVHFNRIGLYFNVRKLLSSALEKVSSSKIPFLHSIITKILPQLDKSEIESDEVCEALRLAGDLVGRQPLVKGLLPPTYTQTKNPHPNIARF
jgi:hypothetical protein